MYCVNCGKEVPDSAKFCGHCGQDPRQPQSVGDTKPQKTVQAQRPAAQPSAAEAKPRSPLRWIIPVGLILAAAAVVFFVLPALNPPDQDLVNASIQLTVAAGEQAAAPAEPINTQAPAPSATPEESVSAAEIEPTATQETAAEHAPQIAFASDRSNGNQIWIINQDGSDLQQLTNLPGGACQPSWAPDGSALAFTSPCDGNRSSYPNAAIFMYTMESGAITQLSEGPGDYDPAWSPNGDHIAFTSLRLGRSQIFYYFLNSEQSIDQSSPSVYEYQPAWSADASQMALVSTANGDELIFFFNLLDGQRIQLLTSEQSEGKLVSSPRWAPDGQGIYYTRTPRSGGFAELYYLPMPGDPAAHQAFFSEAVPGRDVSFSADGEWIAFESWPNTDNHDIWLATSAGQDRTRLTDNLANEYDAAWRP